jgi:type I restriction enzyme S subunit
MPGSNGARARKITVKLYGKGVLAKAEDRAGSDKTQYYRRSAGQLIYSKLDFLNGAIGLVPPALDGYESTLDLPCFDIDTTRIHPEWLLAILSRPAFYGRFRASAVGGRKAKRVQPTEFLAYRLAIPPLPEQRRIAAALGSVDRAIAGSQTLIDALREAKRNVMHELLTHGHPACRTELVPLREPWPIGRIAPVIDRAPAHWRLTRLTEVARLESGHTPSRSHAEYWGGDIPWISLQDVDRLDAGAITETAESITQAGIDNSSARVLPEGTVVFSRTASIGHCAAMGRPMATSQDFANYVCGLELLPAFLLQLFRALGHEWARLCAGTTHQTVYMPVFEALQILLPPLDEQRHIAAAGEAFDRRIEREQTALTRLEEAKQALAQALLGDASGRRLVSRQTRGGGPC